MRQWWTKDAMPRREGRRSGREDACNQAGGRPGHQAAEGWGLQRTSAMSWFSLLMLRCVRVSRYSFLVFWMKVSGAQQVRGGGEAGTGGRC